MSNGLDIK